MSARTARKSATVAATARKGSNVVSIKPDAKLADVAHAKERALILDGIDAAEGLLGEALVEGLRMTVKLGQTSKDEVAAHYTRCNSPDVYASWFNLGFKAQAIVGEKLALEAIDRAIASGKGSAFQRAREALSAIKNVAKEAGVKQVDGRKATALVKDAVKVAFTAATTRATAKKSAKGAQPARTATMAAAAIESGKGAKEVASAVKLASQNASRMAAPEGKETAWKEAVAALQLAAEKFAPFAK